MSKIPHFICHGIIYSLSKNKESLSLIEIFVVWCKQPLILSNGFKSYENFFLIGLIPYLIETLISFECGLKRLSF